ncbi:DUF4139 domain-containing protein [Streptomyces sp. NBC_00320]|uniref:DUF4139 domain-containing protein n=1 Tax=Streptomyces sp. NBC_00320 TaxID=2975711 RepID=UPI0022524987|nr:DUF4139 domain-containing protein [Streptomyces sp. NBC_00320]MCX5152039.1 DUF4139 domain-containing protein [Streptomyces sp. NBC_00320]
MTAETPHTWRSTLDSVVVYAQGAVCRRLVRGSVPANGRLRVTGLPRSLDPGSLRVRVLGAPGVRVTEARVEVEAGLPDIGAPDTLRREVVRLRLIDLRWRRRAIRGTATGPDRRRPWPLPPAAAPAGAVRSRTARTPDRPAWPGSLDFVEERLTQLHTRLAELEEALRRVEHELAVAADRLARASTDAPSAHVETTVCAVLTLDATGDAEAETDAELELEYAVPGAVWVPAYRLTHRQGDGTGRLVLRASVAQRTGEDWTGVRIALATADLQRRTDLPRLRSVRIGRRQPAPAPSGWREPPAGLADLFTGYLAAGPRPAPPTPRPAPAALRVGSASGPVPPPPPPPSVPKPQAPQGYGAAPGAFPVPGGADGATPAVFGASMPAPAQPGRSRAAGRPAGGGFGGAPATMAPAAMAPAAPAAPGGAPPPQPAPPPAGPPQPSGAELDYAALVLCGPDEQGSRRGRLFPGSPFDPEAAAYRRRAEAVAGLPLPRHAVRPRTSAGSFDHRFDAAARVDVPSDGTWQTVTVGEIPVGLRTEYLCVPSVEPTVYATLLLSNATGQALLAGPVEVTVDGEFLLTAALPTLAPGGVRRVGLGPAEGIAVTRRTNLHESTSGLRGNTTVLDHRVHVELANRLARPVTVEVRERVPVTTESDVRIEERADWTAPEAGTGPEHHAPGTRVWRVELPVGATAALDGGYEIRIPAGKALVDGNRRS